jgi:hypothetical protein
VEQSDYHCNANGAVHVEHMVKIITGDGGGGGAAEIRTVGVGGGEVGEVGGIYVGGGGFGGGCDGGSDGGVGCGDMLFD